MRGLGGGALTAAALAAGLCVYAPPSIAQEKDTTTAGQLAQGTGGLRLQHRPKKPGTKSDPLAGSSSVIEARKILDEMIANSAKGYLDTFLTTYDWTYYLKIVSKIRSRIRQCETLAKGGMIEYVTVDMTLLEQEIKRVQKRRDHIVFLINLVGIQYKIDLAQFRKLAGGDGAAKKAAKKLGTMGANKGTGYVAEKWVVHALRQSIYCGATKVLGVIGTVKNTYEAMRDTGQYRHMKKLVPGMLERYEILVYLNALVAKYDALIVRQKQIRSIAKRKDAEAKARCKKVCVKPGETVPR